MSVVAKVNPETFYELSCEWNLQLADYCRPEECSTTWTSADEAAAVPQIFHASGRGKEYGKLSLVKPHGLARNCTSDIFFALM